MILFQGLDDKVVPPEQSRLIVGQLKTRGIDVAYREFAGEAHGFRKAETITLPCWRRSWRSCRGCCGLA